MSAEWPIVAVLLVVALLLGACATGRPATVALTGGRSAEQLDTDDRQCQEAARAGTGSSPILAAIGTKAGWTLGGAALGAGAGGAIFLGSSDTASTANAARGRLLGFAALTALGTALGFVIGTFAGLAKGVEQARANVDDYRTAWTRCMTERGYTVGPGAGDAASVHLPRGSIRVRITADMRVVMPVALPEVLRLRKQTGADRFDEMWEGVLHMPPAPSIDHQDTASGIWLFFREVWAPRTGGFAVVQANVSTPDRWDRDYRIPDVAVMTRETLPAPGAVYVLPTVVFEVRSPGDETFEKLSFYAAVGIKAVVIVERDTKAVQVFTLAGDSFVLEAPGPDGWLTIRTLEVEIRSDSSSGSSRLALRLAGAPGTVSTV